LPKSLTPRNNAKKEKELTVIGFLVEEQKEFSRLFTKLRMEWRTAKGDISFSALKAGWFEINFSNHTLTEFGITAPTMCLVSYYLSNNGTPDLTPPKNQSPSLIFRLHFLPEEFANSEALTAIIEGNFAGSFLKMDPNHNNIRMNMFTRFCINTDVGLNVGKRIIIHDENCNPIKYKLLFVDFPDGCGACGLPDHVFKECPNRAIPIPILRITIKKSTSKFLADQKTEASSSDCNNWCEVGKNNKAIPNKYTNLNHQYKPHLAEKSGVSFIYESEDSDEILCVDPDQDLELDAPPHLISALDGIPKLEINVDHDSLYGEQGQEKENVIDGNTTAMEQRTTGFEAQINEQDSSFFQDELTNILN
ncbi:LOW QUALITY PROTEIN: hypothetical protein V2J09_024036, partial [Rumex salicifolius]